MIDLRLGFIGAGNMAGAIIDGILGKKLLSPGEIGVFDVDRDKLAQYRDKGLMAFNDIPSLAAACRYTVLSVKPQQFPQVLPQVKETITKDKILVSIAAGISAKAIQEGVGFPCKLVMAGPNTPLMLGFGATALCPVPPCTEEEFSFVQSLFGCAGETARVSQDMLHDCVALVGSSPAFVYRLAKIMTDKAQAAGVDQDAAHRLFCHTLIGAAQMMLRSGKSCQELIDMVCSPGGTTLAALKAMDEAGFDQALEAGYDACVKLAKELAG